MAMRTTRKDIIEAGQAYIDREFGGDWKLAFEFEDRNRDGQLSLDEVSGLLAKWGIGWRATRWKIALEIIRAMDGNGDGYVDFEEFRAMTGVE